jgi:RNA-directed DNA polymerase
MGQLFQRATEKSSLRNAWLRIKENGSASLAHETRVAIEMFSRDVDRNIHKIQRRLRDGVFEFEPQKGVLKRKGNGGVRGIVMASVQNRLVERAWLDCLQSHSDFVKRVINQPSSVGGVPHRSVPHGLKLIRDAFDEGKAYYIRSDISGFFDNIPRQAVLNKITIEIEDKKFLEVLSAATTVVLANEQALGENRKVFPIDGQGVAQGSPLSPLFGNILLNDFDLRLNDRGITCVRFIDDFVLLGRSESNVSKAFRSARELLQNLGLNCHDPFARKTEIEKASFGSAETGFVFLGYDIRPGLFQPSRTARQKLERQINEHLQFGRWSITEVRKAGDSFESRQRYIQTMALLDKVIRGWGDAFAYANASDTIEALDRHIDSKLDDFRSWFSKQIRDEDWKSRRRMGGVCLLGDIPMKSLDDVPFKLEAGKRFIRTPNTVTISTDGSTAASGKRRKEQGPGGWAFVVHETGEKFGGRSLSTTNNRMELQAVIEAIKYVDPKKPVQIRTDSQYVTDAIAGRTVIKANADLWKEYEEISRSRRMKVIWVKGHAGDPYNEAADQLAFQQANLAKSELLRTTALNAAPSRPAAPPSTPCCCRAGSNPASPVAACP